MTKGGIFPCILGTFILSFGAMALALPFGIGAAIYLSEYAREGILLRLIRLGINNLAGVPSIVFGLFGLAFFCHLSKIQSKYINRNMHTWHTGVASNNKYSRRGHIKCSQYLQRGIIWTGGNKMANNK